MIKKEMLYSLRDITIIPQVLTTIQSRTECNPYRDSIEYSPEQKLPIIVSPMSCVISEDTYSEFLSAGLNCIIPRTTDFKLRLELMYSVFTAFSLKEAEWILSEIPADSRMKYILLDMANGHMLGQIEAGKRLKEKFGDTIVLMGGNIANPATYLSYELSGAFDYLRCIIGAGAGCLTSTQTGTSYPTASLISDICDLRPTGYRCKVIADGGIGCYSDIIKCLALGADYVMCGRIFAKAALTGESVGDSKLYYGMSTKRAQTEMGNTRLKTSEGKHLELKKEYTLRGWVENMTDYLRSAMSYCDSRDLLEFREKAVCQVISPRSSQEINEK